MSAYDEAKNLIKRYFPKVYYLLQYYRERLIDNISMRTTFTKAYHGEIWNIRESFSGPGSDLEQTEEIRRELPKLLHEIGAKTLLDAPCGDFYWMSQLNLDLEKYIGLDIVSEIISTNITKYSNNNRDFIIADIAKDSISKVDIILCRDCLVHFNTYYILQSINNFKKSGSIYLLTTTFPSTQANRVLMRTGSWQPLNLQLPPFNFPEPLKLINEKCTLMHGNYADKNLGLWKLSEL